MLMRRRADLCSIETLPNLLRRLPSLSLLWLPCVAKAGLSWFTRILVCLSNRIKSRVFCRPGNVIWLIERPLWTNLRIQESRFWLLQRSWWNCGGLLLDCGGAGCFAREFWKTGKTAIEPPSVGRKCGMLARNYDILLPHTVPCAALQTLGIRVFLDMCHQHLVD